MDDLNKHQKYKTDIIKSDLASARKQGKTYNEMHEEAFQSDKAKGALSEKAVKEHHAYELYSPKEVRAEVENWKTGAGRGQVNPRMGHDAGEMGKKWQDTFDK